MGLICLWTQDIGDAVGAILSSADLKTDQVLANKGADENNGREISTNVSHPSVSKLPLQRDPAPTAQTCVKTIIKKFQFHSPTVVAFLWNQHGLDDLRLELGSRQRYRPSGRLLPSDQTRNHQPAEAAA